MKRWGLVITSFYVAVLLLLSFPLAYAAMWPKTTAADILSMYAHLPLWLWLLVLGAGEMLLLFVPVRVAERRPIGRRPLLVPVVATGFFLGWLTFFFVLSILLAIWGDALGKQSLANVPEAATGIGLCVLIVLTWAAWGLFFYRRTRADDPEALVRRASTWLLRGSILELLVAVLCHVEVRRRDECCAPAGTFLGIAAGLSIMLLAFGPGVLVLFQERRRKLKN